MNLVLNYDYHVDIHELKPIIKKTGIYFPLSVENEYIEEDGFSFGCPVDSGKYSTVTYEKAVGVLADDTLSLANEKNSKKMLRFSLLDFVEFREVKDWHHGLPEIEPDLVYDLWPINRQAAYRKAHELSEYEFTKEELILNYQGQQLYKKNGQYFAACGEHWNYGHITPVSLQSEVTEKMIVDIMQSKKRLNEAENARISKLNENIKLLATIFGHTAQV
ncbi:TPA: hypothetical protein OUI11_003387 [Acinetobacter baumannii]|nr:hypothetical protein [Acinetobacter baumannii]